MPEKREGGAGEYGGGVGAKEEKGAKTNAYCNNDKNKSNKPHEPEGKAAVQSFTDEAKKSPGAVVTLKMACDNFQTAVSL